MKDTASKELRAAIEDMRALLGGDGQGYSHCVRVLFAAIDAQHPKPITGEVPQLSPEPEPETLTDAQLAALMSDAWDSHEMEPGDDKRLVDTVESLLARRAKL